MRQIYYLGTVAGLVPKTEDAYKVVKTDLTIMRKDGSMPYDWLADWDHAGGGNQNTFGSVQAALEETARLYRKALWADANAYVEIWLGKKMLWRASFCP